MFGKKDIEKVVNEIKKYFPYLFEDGFQIIDSKYDKMNFGNWIVILHSDKCRIRIYQDRGQIFVMVGPSWASTNLEDTSHYFDIGFVIAFLEKNEVVDFYADLQHIELQYTTLSRELLIHYRQIVQLINDPDYQIIEKELRELRVKILAKSFPQVFGKKT